MRTKHICAVAIAAVGILWFAEPSRALSPEARCEAGKHKEAGRYASCLHRAEAKLRQTEGLCSVTSTTTCHRDDECPMGETCLKDTNRYAAAINRSSCDRENLCLSS